MLDYTKAAFDRVISDLKGVARAYTVGAHLVYISYLVYALIASVGILAVNITLLALTACNLLFYIIYLARKTKELGKLRREVNRYYRWLKLTIRAYPLVIVVYNVFIASEEMSALSIVVAAFTAIIWIIQLILELAIMFLEMEFNYIMIGVKADVENIMKPIYAAKDFASRVMGKEPEARPAPEQSWQRRVLDERVAETRAQQQKEKAKKGSKLRFITRLVKAKSKKDVAVAVASEIIDEVADKAASTTSVVEKK